MEFLKKSWQWVICNDIFYGILRIQEDMLKHKLEFHLSNPKEGRFEKYLRFQTNQPYYWFVQDSRKDIGENIKHCHIEVDFHRAKCFSGREKNSLSNVGSLENGRGY